MQTVVNTQRSKAVASILLAILRVNNVIPLTLIRFTFKRIGRIESSVAGSRPRPPMASKSCKFICWQGDMASRYKSFVLSLKEGAEFNVNG